jgi:hypothetical protein
MQSNVLIMVLIPILLCLQPPLVQAIFSGDPEEIRMLIHKTEDVNALVRDSVVLSPGPLHQGQVSSDLSIFFFFLELWTPLVHS